MQFLTPAQCSDWFVRRGIPEMPFKQPPQPPLSLYAQVNVAKRRERIADLLDALERASIGPFLLQMQDWSSFETEPLCAALKMLWTHNTDQTNVFWFGGIEFSPSERAAFRECATQVLSEGMTGYLYSADAQSVVLLWEGDLIDLWARDHATFAALTSSLAGGESSERGP